MWETWLSTHGFNNIYFNDKFHLLLIIEFCNESDIIIIAERQDMHEVRRINGSHFYIISL